LRSRWACLGPAACAIALLCSPACSSGVRVNAGVVGSLTDIIFHIGKERKYFEKEGLEVFLVPLPASAGAPIQALATGTVDVVPAPLNVNLAGLMRESGIRIVAGYTRCVKGKPNDAIYLVRKDLAAEIKTFADFKGRVIVTPTPGIWNHIALLRELDKAGLSEKDFTGKLVPPNILPSLFVNKQIDAAVAIEPLASRIIDAGLAVALAGTDIAKESSPVLQLNYSGRFMKDQRSARRFMVAVLRSIREFSRASPEELDAIAKKAWGMPVDIKELSKVNMVADGEIDARSLASAVDYAMGKGWLKSRIDIKDIIDPSYVRYANEALRDAPK